MALVPDFDKDKIFELAAGHPMVKKPWINPRPAKLVKPKQN